MPASLEQGFQTNRISTEAKMSEKLQAKWVAQVLSGRVALPSQEEMEADTEAFYDLLRRHNVPVRHTHCQVLAIRHSRLQ